MYHLTHRKVPEVRCPHFPKFCGAAPGDPNVPNLFQQHPGISLNPNFWEADKGGFIHQGWNYERARWQIHSTIKTGTVMNLTKPLVVTYNNYQYHRKTSWSNITSIYWIATFSWVPTVCAPISWIQLSFGMVVPPSVWSRNAASNCGNAIPDILRTQWLEHCRPPNCDGWWHNATPNASAVSGASVHHTCNHFVRPLADCSKRLRGQFAFHFFHVLIMFYCFSAGSSFSCFVVFPLEVRRVLLDIVSGYPLKSTTKKGTVLPRFRPSGDPPCGIFFNTPVRPIFIFGSILGWWFPHFVFLYYV